MKRPGRFIRGPIRPDRWSALRFASMRWAALPVIDRRWTMPLSGLALGFGLFVGIAIGPVAEGRGSEDQAQTVVEVVQPPQAQVPDDAGGPAGDGPAGDGNHGDNTGPSTPTPSPPTDNGPFGDTPAPPTSTPPPTTTTTTPPTTTTTTTTTPTGGDDGGDDNPPAVPTANGIVVHVNELAGSYTVARSNGSLVAVHADELPSIGAVVKVQVRTLANGTKVETNTRDRTDRAEQADVTGTVTFSDPRIGAYTLSAPGTSVLVRVPAGDRMPAVGDVAQATVRIADGLDPIEAEDPGRDGCGKPPKTSRPPAVGLEQLSIDVSESAGSTSLEGIVQGVCHKEATIIVSSDDLRAAGRDIAITVPSNVNLGEISPGQVLAIRALIGGKGNLTATRIADDEGASAADDAASIQP
jgi:hypothetical protein